MLSGAVLLTDSQFLRAEELPSDDPEITTGNQFFLLFL